MSSSKLFLPLLAVLALAGCTAAPLHGQGPVSPVTGQPLAGVETLSGRIAVSEAGSRTAQVVRNPLLFRLNGATPVREPLYEVVLDVSGFEQDVSVQGGSGVPTASLYRIQASYTVRRVSDGAVLGSGTRFSTAPYDRSEQLFAADRALIDARDKSAAELADRLAVAVLPILRREIEGQPALATN
ncbi:hypothetical protein [Aureimonas populi]|uniref:LPS-assembly lipoprotein n=1 Tax=Aureimonas populi TaxID=1701758 RepID=A0ABW5CRG8_9HYPH|nr:hypothetical protein [Aureimonas populi]